MHVGTFITRMYEEYGLSVKIYTVDEWVAVIDDLTIKASGLVKKNATKKDMERMLSDNGEINDVALDWAELLWNPVNSKGGVFWLAYHLVHNRWYCDDYRSLFCRGHS